MSNGAKIEGVARLQYEIGEVDKEMQHNIKDALNKTGLILRGTIIKAMARGNPTGVFYTRGGQTARRSAPGEPPARDTGHLDGSIVFKTPKTIGAGTIYAEVYTDVPYGKDLEWGTMKVKARPLWVPTVKAEEKNFLKRIENAILDAIK